MLLINIYFNSKNIEFVLMRVMILVIKPKFSEA